LNRLLLLVVFAIVLLAAKGSLAFAPPPLAPASFRQVDQTVRSKRLVVAGTPPPRGGTTTTTTTSSSTTRRLARNDDDNNKTSKKNLEEGLRTKLVTESIAPWRTVRLFLYGALGSGAAVGGFITLAGTLAALSGARSDLDLNTESVNLAIDFGAVAVFAFLAKWDLDKQSELNQKVEEKIEKKKEQKKVAAGMKEREQQLANLQLNIQVSTDGDTKEATIRDLQVGAKQHMIIVAGPRKACRDALVGANLMKMNFAMKNVLVVPFDIDETATPLDTGGGSGFGERPVYETQSYVARPAGDKSAWREYIESEMKDAVTQNGEKARQEGIAIVVANSGKIIRRGVGKVPWRQMVEELEQTVSGESTKSSSFF